MCIKAESGRKLNKNVDITKEDILKIHKFAIVRFSKVQDVDDFVSVALLKKITTKQTLQQAYIDYLRATRGRNETKKNFKLLLDNNSRVIPLVDNYGAQTPNPIKNILFSDIIKKVRKQLRAIIILKLIWGLTNKEISYCFGMNESRISQILKEICLKLGRTNG
jgi:hypothetical protein